MKEYYGNAKYQGSYNSGDWSSIIVEASSFVIYFYSTSSVEDWGFKAYVLPTF
jgi:hypothetical protein